MVTNRMGRVAPTIVAALLATSLVGCGAATKGAPAESAETAEAAVSQETIDETEASLEEATQDGGREEVSEDATTSRAFVTTSLDSMVSDGAIDTTDLFTERDLQQEADLSDAVYLTVESGQDLVITEEGVYVLSGTAEGATVTVNVDSAEKVQLVLDGLSITNVDFPAINVISADKVFVTTTEGSQNVLSVTGTFAADGDTNTDAVIFSKDDLVLNGLGTLTISSTDNGITSKDDLKVTGGTLAITSQGDALEANDSIRIAGGTLGITTSKDGLHAENDEDDTLGYVYICGGTISIEAGDDGIQGTTVVQIDGGTISVNAGEAIEGTYVQVNGGDLNLSAWDDGINASWKSQSVGYPTVDICGGNIVITMAQGDTDALDSNGYLYVSGGTVDITAQFAFDFEYGAEYTGGTIYVNGQQVSEITESMMMGGPGGMMGGGPGGGMGPGGW